MLTHTNSDWFLEVSKVEHLTDATQKKTGASKPQ